jgi:hypothetical protein
MTNDATTGDGQNEQMTTRRLNQLKQSYSFLRTISIRRSRSDDHDPMISIRRSDDLDPTILSRLVSPHLKPASRISSLVPRLVSMAPRRANYDEFRPKYDEFQPEYDEFRPKYDEFRPVFMTTATFKNCLKDCLTILS